MKILHLNGFTKAELMGFKPVLHSNAIEIVQTLLHGCTELGIQVAPEHQDLFNKIEELSSIETPVDQQLARTCCAAVRARRVSTRSSLTL